MKKLITFYLLFAVFFLVCVSIFAQTDSIGNNFPVVVQDWLIAFYKAHAWVAYVVLLWGVISEILPSIKGIAANSTWQFIINGINWFFGLLKPATKAGKDKGTDPIIPPKG